MSDLTAYIIISVFVFLQLALVVQLYYTLVIHLGLRRHKHPEASEVILPVSVIICARNERENLEQNLTAVLGQDHPDFEVVVVNDCSADGSDEVLRQFSRQYPHLKVVTIEEHVRFKHGKKFAVTLGIKAAKNEYLIFTDADCKPASASWIRRIQQNFKNGKEIVLGYSPYIAKPGPLNLFIRYETFLTALNYLSFSLAGEPYMGVGRNLAYTKSMFFRGKGFASHMHIPSGDDDLFVNQNATAQNTVIDIHPDAHVYTIPKETFGAYIKQKLRHAGAGRAYKTKHKRILVLQAVSSILFYLSLSALIVLGVDWWMILSCFMFRLLVQILVYFPIFKKLGYKDLIWWFPALDLIYNFYIIVLSIISSFKKKVQWK